jgi:hypothetical protein
LRRFIIATSRHRQENTGADYGFKKIHLIFLFLKFSH